MKLGSPGKLLIGVLVDPPGLRIKGWAGTLVYLREADYELGLCNGLANWDESAVGSIAGWLTHRPGQRWYQSDSGYPGIEPPGWLERELEGAGCSWFIPLAHRIAAGEKVPLEEITAAYSAANQGRPMPRGTTDELFAYAKQHGLIK